VVTLGRVAICAVALLAAAGGAQAQPPRFEVRPLDGPPACASTVPRALDERGQVVGGRCLWNPGATLSPPDAAHPDVFADGIAGGVVAGHAVGEDLLAVPVLWVNGEPRRLPLGPGFRQGLAQVINAHRDVLGEVSGPGGTQVALWRDGKAPAVITLSPKAGNRDLRDLNGSRQVVGCASFASLFGGEIVPFVWAGGQTRILEPSSADDPAGCAYAINDAGVVAGESAQRPVLWRNGKVQPLAPPGHVGQTLDINAQGEAVGVVEGRSFYWDGDRLWDLLELIEDQSLAPTLGRVIAINDRGQILVTRPTPAAPLAGVALLVPRGPAPAAFRVTPR
jgi:hypothetical protein